MNCGREHRDDYRLGPTSSKLRVVIAREDDDVLLAAVLERLLTYLRRARGRELPVWEDVGPAQIEAAFAEHASLSLADGEPHERERLLAAIDETLRLSVHTASPRFFNQSFAGPDPIGVAGDWIATALNTTGATFEMAPVFTLMELHLLRRLAQLAGLPVAAHSPGEPPPRAGLMLAGGSLSNLHALQLARHRAAPQLRDEGAVAGPRFAVFTSAHAHYSIRKAAQLLGMGSRAVVRVAVDDQGRMRPDALARAIVDARAAGLTPLFVNATAGTTVVGAFDPIEELAAICRREDLWLHVDGCFGASLLFSPALRHHLAGIEQADSIAWNFHKMMGMPQQCATLLLRSPEQLRGCFAEQAEYLFQPDKPYAGLDSGDLGFLCGRRVDALEAWLSWKRYGDAGMAARVETAVANADYLRERIAASSSFVSAYPGGPCHVLFWWVPASLRPFALDSADSVARARLHALAPAIKLGLRARGQVMLSFSPIDGQPNSFRMLFMNPEVTREDIDVVLSEIEAVGAALD